MAHFKVCSRRGRRAKRSPTFKDHRWKNDCIYRWSVQKIGLFFQKVHVLSWQFMAHFKVCSRRGRRAKRSPTFKDHRWKKWLHLPLICAENRRSFSSLHEVRRTCRTCPAKLKNDRRGPPVKFNQMSGEEVQMSGEAKRNFVYTDHLDLADKKRALGPSTWTDL